MRYSILVVDDNAMNLRLSQKILSKLEHKVIIARIADEAVEMAKAHGPNLILLDMSFPTVEGGLETLRRLRSLPETKDSQIVAISAQAMPAQVESFLAGGCIGYIQRPISIQAFLAEVQHHLRSNAGETQSPGAAR